jgi:N-acetylneuraminic acid mutarotase
VTNTWLPISSGLTSTTSEYREYAAWTGTEVIAKSGRYDPALDQWTATSTPPRTRTGATRVWTGSRVVVWGGCWDQGVGGCQVDSRGEWYEPATNTWGLINSGLSSTAMDHVAVWTGTHMVAQGGGLTFTGGSGGIRYHAASDTFVGTIDIGGAPNTESTLVWTGSAAIMFGGRSGLSVSGTGLSSNPATGVWSSISLTGAPSARTAHTATWTGSQMVVWGGGTSTSMTTSNTNTGARYTPGADSWAATTLTGAPSARREHGAVWSGSEVLVWGGQNGTTALADGGRYDPIADTWLPISATNAPSPRYRHVTVWTGTEMIVWGGYNGTTWLDDGGRYNPQTDTWTPIASSPTITARAYAGAVWTGTQMIVWGGQTSTTTSTNTGAAYTPGGTWTALPTTGAPTARLSPAVGWMNGTLFVWGGPATSSSSNGQPTGAIYDPAGPSWTTIATTDAPPTSGYTDVALWTGTFVYLVTPPAAAPRVYVP